MLFPGLKRGSLLLVLRRHRVDQVLDAFGTHSLVPRAAILLLLTLSEHHRRERVDDAVSAGHRHDSSEDQELIARFLDQRPIAKRFLSSSRPLVAVKPPFKWAGVAVVGLQCLLNFSRKRILIIISGLNYQTGCFHVARRAGFHHKEVVL